MAFTDRRFMRDVLDGLYGRLSDEDVGDNGLRDYCVSLDIPVPRSYHYGLVPYATVVNDDQLPAVIVSPLRSELEPVLNATGSLSSVGQTHEFAVDIITGLEKNTPSESNVTAAQRLTDYAAAVEAVVNNDRTLGLSEAVVFAFVTEHNYEPLSVEGLADFYPRARLTVRVEHVEN